KQTIDCLRDLQRLRPMPAVADHVDLTERFMVLDSVLLADRLGFRYLGALVGGKFDEAFAPLGKELKNKKAAIDWDPGLRNGNQLFDRMVAAMRLKDRGQREKELDRIERSMGDLKASLVDPKHLHKMLLGPDATPASRGKVLGDALVCLLIPATHKLMQASDRSEQIQRNLRVAFALGAYQRDNGQYPRKLDELAPKYLAVIPTDLFTGKSLTYRPAGEGYLLYSFGANGRDDGGRSYDDDPPGDDLRVLMPRPK